MALTEEELEQMALTFFRRQKFAKKPLMDRHIVWLTLDHLTPAYHQSLAHPPTTEDSKEFARAVESA